jgi:tetratricopeptide (TPR) repeat protein
MNARAYPERPALILAILALGILLLGLTPYPRAFTEAMRQAETHRTAGEYSAALAAYQEAARHDPESPLPWLRAGQVLLAQHRYLQATVAFREAERLGEEVAATMGLGESYAGRGDWAAAIQTWLRAQAQAPDDARVRVALGRGALAQGQFAQAEQYLAQALELEAAAPEAQAAHALMGRLLAANDPEGAALHLRQAGDADMLAVLRAAQAEANPLRRTLTLGAAFLQRGELLLARRAFERAVDQAPAAAEPLAYLAHALDRLGETVLAGELLAQALDLDPESVLAHYFLASHHRQVGNVERAMETLWQALLLDPENAALHVEMGEAFVALGDYGQAEEWYLGAVEAAPDEVEFQRLLAHFYLDHLYRIEEGGLPAAQAIVGLAPGDARAQDLLGWAFHLAGKPVEGSEVLLLALALDPDLVSAHFHLGSLYLSTGRSELARQYLRRAADLDTGGYYRQRAEMLLSELD